MAEVAGCSQDSVAYINNDHNTNLKFRTGQYLLFIPPAVSVDHLIFGCVHFLDLSFFQLLQYTLYLLGSISVHAATNENIYIPDNNVSRK